jgi:outer membrane protein OmpA-like peptidoglycan-associated protein
MPKPSGALDCLPLLYLFFTQSELPRVKLHRYSVLLFFVLTAAGATFAQEPDSSDCLNSRAIVFPLSQNDFTDTQILVEGDRVNAFYYLYQDKYTFWYKFLVVQNTDIQFSVSPSEDGDRYGVSVYSFGKNDFCEKLVAGGLEPEYPEKIPVMSKGGKIRYSYVLNAAAGDTYYISVLSMNPDDCGHFLYLEAGGQKMSFHAIHRPCYNFGRLEAPDFSLSKIYPKDVGIYLEGLEAADQESAPNLEEPIAEEPSDEKPAKEDPPENSSAGYGGFTETLIESAEEGIVSVGDRLVLKKVYFYNNTYALKPEAEEELQQLLNFLIDNPTVEVEVEGHSANDTEEIIPDPNFKGQGREWNFKGSALKLSEKRADEVKDYLVENGVNKRRLTTVGYGDSRKRIPEASTFEEFEQNMRVEILITAQ